MDRYADTDTARILFVEQGIWSPRPKKTRLYTTVTDTEVLEETGLARPEYTARGEDEASDKAWDKYNRAEIKIMRRKALAWLAANGYEGVKVNFSRHAGCSGCPCSPGFIVEKTLSYGENSRAVDSIFVH